MDAQGAPLKTTSYAWYVAGVLCLAQIIAIADRYLLSVLVEPIKADLGLSDSQIGLLTGVSFTILFVTASMPLGRLADIWNRKVIIFLGLLTWSLATMASGFARNFEELFATRLLVGLGEAALLPAAMSLITAYFSKSALGRGVSVFSMGLSLGRAAGFAGGGAAYVYFTARHGLALPHLAHLSPWHAVFVAAGAMGLVVSFAMWTIREPKRIRVLGVKSASTGQSLDYLWRNRAAYTSVFVPASANAAMLQLLGAWAVSFYARRHGLGIGQAAGIVGATSLIVGPLAHLSGGWIADRLRAMGVSAAPPLLLGFFCALLPIGFAAFCYAPTVPLTIAAYGLTYLVLSAPTPSGYAGVQLLTPAPYRGAATAVFLACYTVIGYGLGPLVVGLINNLGFHDEGRLGSSMVLAVASFALLGAPFGFLWARAFRKLIEADLVAVPVPASPTSAATAIQAPRFQALP
jgi:MFS family permease